MPEPQSLPAWIPKRHFCLKIDIFLLIPLILVATGVAGLGKERHTAVEAGWVGGPAPLQIAAKGGTVRHNQGRGASGSDEQRPQEPSGKGPPAIAAPKVKACINAVIHALCPSRFLSAAVNHRR